MILISCPPRPGAQTPQVEALVEWDLLWGSGHVAGMRPISAFAGQGRIVS